MENTHLCQLVAPNAQCEDWRLLVEVDGVMITVMTFRQADGFRPEDFNEFMQRTAMRFSTDALEHMLQNRT